MNAPSQVRLARNEGFLARRPNVAVLNWIAVDQSRRSPRWPYRNINQAHSHDRVFRSHHGIGAERSKPALHNCSRLRHVPNIAGDMAASPVLISGFVGLFANVQSDSFMDHSPRRSCGPTR